MENEIMFTIITNIIITWPWLGKIYKQTFNMEIM